MSREQAIDCFRSDDLIGIGMEADAVRRRLHPDGVVTYSCVSVISATAQPRPLWISTGTVRLEVGAIGAADLARACAAIREEGQSPWIEVRIGSAAPLASDPAELVSTCADAGAHAILVDPRDDTGNYVQLHEAAIAVHRAAHRWGIRTVATIPFGGDESVDDRVGFLESVRLLHEETGGFVAVMPLGIESRGGRELDGVTAVERLKMLAVTRMYLESIPHLRSVQTGAGLKVLQTALRFGANDTELRIPQSGTTEQDLRRVIRDAGFRPVERDATYSTMYLN